MIFIGIDPGFTGAVAVVDNDGNLIAVSDTPVLTVQGKKTKQEYNIPAMHQILAEHAEQGIHAALEQVSSRPGEGVVSSFRFGRGLGLWEALLVACRIPFDRITPQCWKKSMMAGRPKKKDASRLRAMELFPQADLRLKKHHGRADALLMAEYLRRAVGTRDVNVEK